MHGWIQVHTAHDGVAFYVQVSVLAAYQQAPSGTVLILGGEEYFVTESVAAVQALIQAAVAGQ